MNKNQRIIGVLALPFTGFMTLGNLLNLSGPWVLICKLELVIAPNLIA